MLHDGPDVEPALRPLPIVPRRHVELTGKDREQIAGLAAELVVEYRRLSDTTFFGAGVSTGLGPEPAVLIGDKSEISLLSVDGEDHLEYRIALLAGGGDLIVFSSRRNSDFEAYLCELLDLTRLNILQARITGAPPHHPTALRCMEDRHLNERLEHHVRANGGTTLLPHISTGTIWALAKQLHGQTGLPIRIAGPPPGLSRKVNDKIWFGEIATRLLGKTAVPEKCSAFGPAALTGHVRRLAQKWEKLVIKVPDSAGSAGNFPIHTRTVQELGAAELRHYLMNLLSAAGWPVSYPLLVEVWDCNVLANPSVQTWIPKSGDGEPVIEGVFDQILSGEEGRFIGAAQVGLDTEWSQRICCDAMKLALLFQHLGYFGRCSFDMVIAGRSDHEADIHWIECNGRWGGVSLPMTFLNRLFDPAEMPQYLIVQRSETAIPPVRFSDALNRLEGLLYRRGGEPKGIILATPACLEAGTGFHMIAMARTMEEAIRYAEVAEERLAAAGPA